MPPVSTVLEASILMMELVAAAVDVLLHEGSLSIPSRALIFSQESPALPPSTIVRSLSCSSSSHPDCHLIDLLFC